MRKKIFNVFVCVLTTVIMLAGCTNTDSKEESSQQNESIQQSENTSVTGISLDNTGEIIDQKLEDIIKNGPGFSSSPYDYVKDSEDFEYIISLGDKALNYMLDKFESTKDNGLKEYIMAIACSRILDEGPEDKDWATAQEWYRGYISSQISFKNNMAEIYALALDSTILLDPALNHEMKYIAIDTGSLLDVSAHDKNNILRFFEKYSVEVKDASFEELKKQGLYNKDSMSIEGILLDIKEVDKLSDSKVIIQSSKYKSGLGAIGVKSTVVFKGDKWEVESAGITWIS
jgi:hypothetical protein